MASLADLLAGQAGIILDPRHHLRGRGAPQPVSVVRSDGALGLLIDRAVNSDPTPVAIVGQTGQAIILTAGESGVIWRQGEETEAQRAQIEAISEALRSLGSSAGPKASRKRKASESAATPRNLEDDEVLAIILEDAPAEEPILEDARGTEAKPDEPQGSEPNLEPEADNAKEI